MTTVAPQPRLLENRPAHWTKTKSDDVMDALPRNRTGKIMKMDLRRPFWAGHDRATV